jgi:hypothetical protein
MRGVYFFGYGSLVNPETHDFAPVHRARAEGWRRAWVARPERAVCYLSAVPDAHSFIDGLIAPVPAGGWEKLDEREAAYARLDGTDHVSHDSAAERIALYAVAPEHHAAPGPDNPILLSYLDTVIAGYLAVYGPQGAAHFFETTSGWQAPVLDDRAAPRYQRAVAPVPEVIERVDEALASFGSRRLPN